MVMYGASIGGEDPDLLEQLRKSAQPTFTFTPTGFATTADLDAAVKRIETQMLALLGEMQKLSGALQQSRREWIAAELERLRPSKSKKRNRK